MELINIENLKKLAFSLMLISVAWNVVRLTLMHHDPCETLLISGHINSEQNWSTSKCVTQEYHPSSIQMCLSEMKGSVQFLGNEELFSVHQEMMDLTRGIDNMDPAIHSPQNSQCFILENHLTDTTLEIINMFSIGEHANAFKLVDQMKMDERGSCIRTQPSIIIAGMSTVAEKSEYSSQLDKLASIAKKALGTKIVWLLQDENTEEYNQIVMEKLENVPNIHIMDVHRSIFKHFEETKNNTTLCTNKDSCSPTHPRAKMALYWISQVLWNYQCNDVMQYPQKTCCRQTGLPYGLSISRGQVKVFSLMLFCSMMSLLLFLITRTYWYNAHETACKNGSLRSGHKWWIVCLCDNREFFYLLTRFGLMLLYFYICDRTPIFHATNKFYTWNCLMLPMFVVLIAACMFTSKSKRTDFNHVDITREIKGFMQLYVLIYHFTHAATIFPALRWAWIFVTCFFFLSGYGHYSFAWYQYSKASQSTQMTHTHSESKLTRIRYILFGENTWFTFKRYLTVMYRMNFFLLALCFTVDQDPISYHFMPVLSFWFTIFYIIMAICPIQPSDGQNDFRLIRKLAIKFFVFFLVIRLLHIKSFFHWLFYTGIMRNYFKRDRMRVDIESAQVPDDVRAEKFLHYMMSKDMYTFLLGMIFASIIFWKQSRDNKNEKQNLEKTQINGSDPEQGVQLIRSRKFSMQSALISSASISILLFVSYYLNNPGYWFTEKSMHVYLGVLPVIAYIILRNSHNCLRSRYSVFLAWYGDISLELFVGQHNAWLAQNFYSVLVIIPGYFWLNFMLTLFILTFVAHELHVLTGQLQKYIVPNNVEELIWKTIIVIMIAIFLL